MLIAVSILFLLALIFLVEPERQLDDCRFECNHLQTKIDRLEELGEYEMALYQLLTPLGWAQLRAVNEIIKNEQHKAYEGIEQPLLTEEEEEK